MANNGRIRVDIEGDASSLQKSLTGAQEALEGFSKKAGGRIGEFADTFASGLGNSATAMTGFGAALGVTAGTITATFAAVQEASEKAFETMQSASLSQMGLTQIQQMANMYAKVGLSMENIADQQKDVKDKIGDAITNIGGSVYTDIIQPLQLNAGALQKMADSGGDVIAKIYYQAKQMGYSQSQIINMMETIGNDATKRISVLKEFSSEQDYLNSLSSQSIQLTTQQAQQFGEYQTATRNLGNAFEAMANQSLAPVAEKLASILNLMANIINLQDKIQMPVALGGARADVSSSNAQSILDNEKKRAEAERTLDKGTYENMVKYGQLQVNSAAEIAQAQILVNKQKNDQINKDNAAAKGSTGFSAKELDTQSQSFQSGTATAKRQLDILDAAFTAWKTNAQQSLSTAYAGNIDALDKDIAAKTADYQKQRESLTKALTKDQDDAAAKAKTKAEKDAKDAATLAQKNADARMKAEQVIAKAVADTQTNAHAHQLAEFDRQQKALVDQINKAAATLGISPAELLGKQAAASAANRDTLIKNQLGITKSDPNAAINTQNQDIASLQASGNLSEANRQSLVQMQKDRTGTNGMIDTQSALKTNDDAMNAELAQNDLLLKGHEDYEKQKAAITAKYNTQAIQISQQNTKTQLTMFADATQSLGDAVSDVFGKNSAAAKAAFIAQKAIMLAQTIMNIQVALSNAMAQPFPLNLLAYTQVAAMGMSIIATAKSTAGQFHGGVDELPSSMDNKSFVLKAGERVVQPEANKKLSKFLDKQDSSGGSSGDTTVNAPLIINGSTNNDSEFDEMLKKHANNVSLAVRNAQKRNS